jgi:pentatricopeptide repeat protein
MIQRNDLVVDRFWSKLKAMMDYGDREVLDAAGLPVFYDGFIVYYGRKKDTIRNAIEVLRRMISSQTCVPGPITWSVIISMFIKHDQPESAEQIRQLMLQRGVALSETKWQEVLDSTIAAEMKKLLDADDGVVIRRLGSKDSREKDLTGSTEMSHTD